MINPLELIPCEDKNGHPTKSSCCNAEVIDALSLRNIEDKEGQTNWLLCSDCHKPIIVCEYCNGKGYNTRCYDESGSDDFGGEGHTKRGLIEKVPCKKCQKTLPSSPMNTEPTHRLQELVERLEKLYKHSEDSKSTYYAVYGHGRWHPMEE